MIRRPPKATQSRSSAASDVYKRQDINHERYGREVAFALISPILTDYSAGQWLDMLHYLGFGQCDGIEDERDAKRFLQERVKEWPADDL